MMKENQPPAQPASKDPPLAFPETEASERNCYDDLRLKDPKAPDWGLLRVAALICSEQHSEAALAYRDYALSLGLRDELERAVLLYDIRTSILPIQKKLAQDIVFLFLNLEKDHSSDGARTLLESDQEDLLERLQHALTSPTGEPPKRPKLDETQITSIVRGLLEVSGGREDAHQHEFSEDYSASDNADLCASLFGITRTNQFGDFDPEAMRNMLSKSPVFSGVTISVQDLEQWTTKMTDRLCLGFPERYLRSRIDTQHQNALVDLSQTKTPELGGESEEDWIMVTPSNTLSLQGCSQRPRETPVDTESSTEQSRGSNPLQGTCTDTFKVCSLPRAPEEDMKSLRIAAASPSTIHPNQYRLIRLSNFAREDISETLNTKVRTMDEVYHIEELTDGSWELLVLEAQCARLEVTLGKMLPGWDVHSVYDPEEPTTDDLNHWDYIMAKHLRRSWFRERAGRVIKQELIPAAAYYNSHLAHSPNVSDIEPSDGSSGRGFPSMKDRIVQSVNHDNDHSALPASNHKVSSSVQDLPLHPTCIVDSLEIQQVHSLSTHKSNGSLYGDYTDGCDLQYPIVDSPEGSEWYAARMEPLSHHGVMPHMCYTQLLDILAERRPVAVVRVKSANTFDTFKLARVFMAKQYNTGVDIGLAYRDGGSVYLDKITVGNFEDFGKGGIYFTCKQGIMGTIPSGPRWKEEFQSLELQSWLGVRRMGRILEAKS